MLTLHAERISNEAFAPFGTLLDPAIDRSRVDFAGPTTNDRAAARANLAIVRPPVVASGVVIDIVERHPFSTQAFMPLDVVAYVIVVAPDDAVGQADLDRARAFTVPGTMGIVYGVGTWHVGMSVLGLPGGMAMLVHEDGTDGDCEYVTVPGFSVVW